MSSSFKSPQGLLTSYGILRPKARQEDRVSNRVISEIIE